MKISYLIIACLISTLTAYSFDNILSLLHVGLGIEYKSKIDNKYIKLLSIENFGRQDWYGDISLIFDVIALIKGKSKEPVTVIVKGVVA
jgi:hypothetical protein